MSAKSPWYVRFACYIGIAAFTWYCFRFTDRDKAWIIGIGFGIFILMLNEISVYLERRNKGKTFAERNLTPILRQEVIVVKMIYMREGERVGGIGTRGMIKTFGLSRDNKVLVELVDPQNWGKKYGMYTLDELKEA